MDSSEQDEAEQLTLAPSAIEAVDKLGQAARNMLATHAMEGAAEPGLEVAEDPVNPRQDFCRTGGVRSLDAPFVLDAFRRQTAVALEPIRPDGGSMGVNGAPDERAE